MKWVRHNRCLFVLWVGLAAIGYMLGVASVCGCTTRQAQVATQTALTATAEGVSVAAEVLNEQTPELVKTAAAEAEVACPDPCSRETYTDYLDEKLLPLNRAVTGLKVARDACFVAQGTQDAWVASGELPDTAPLCKALGAAVSPVPQLLTDAGVKNVPAEVSALAGPATELVCGAVSRWMKGR